MVVDELLQTLRRLLRGKLESIKQKIWFLFGVAKDTRLFGPAFGLAKEENRGPVTVLHVFKGTCHKVAAG